MYNFADDLVAGNYLRAARRKFSFYDMQIGSTDTTRAHAKQNLTRLEGRHRSVRDHERMVRELSG
jgi:hypothetical protein